jgi:zinc-binding alcohol dehydrogenase/oxidoreductase
MIISPGKAAMKALYLEATNGPESVRVQEVETPLPKAGEVRVAIKAASLNHREMFITHGQYPGMSLPATLGCDGAGVVDMVGEGVTEAKIGDEVVLYPARNWGSNRHAPAADFGLLGMPFDGTIAEYVCVPVENLAPKPEGLSFEEAAAIPLTGLTSWRALMFKGKLQPGETLLISGIGGGVATFGLAFAVALGANVYVTGESEEILTRARDMGAKGGLLYTDPEWRRQVGKLTGGIDVVLDGAPSPSLANYVRAINPGARIVIYGSTAGNEIKFNATDLFLKSASIVGSQVGDPQDFKEMLAFVGEHSIKPVIERVFPLSEAREALLYLRDGHKFGKIVVRA